MLGLGKSPQILDTRQIEDALLLALGDALQDDEIWLISPYVTFGKLGTVRRAIDEACKRGVMVSIVIRDESQQVDPALSDLKGALEHGLKLFAFHRLHAKLYWFGDNSAIVSSANLVDGSFESSTELGLLVPSGRLHEGLRSWIEDILEPNLRVLPKAEPTSRKSKSAPQKSNRHSSTKKQKTGYCIRCSAEISLNPEKPYCLEHYRSWAKFKNPEYVEKHCHSCGAGAKTSMSKPVCYSCYKKS